MSLILSRRRLLRAAIAAPLVFSTWGLLPSAAIAAGFAQPYLQPVQVTGPTYLVSSFVTTPATATAQLQAALNAVKATGGTLVFDQGAITYTVTATSGACLLISGGAGIALIGNGATIKQANSMAVYFGAFGLQLLNCSRIHIQDLTFDGNRAGRTAIEQEGHPCALHHCDLISFLRCNFNNTAGSDGLMISGLGTNEPNPVNFCTNILVKDCGCDNNYRGGIFVRNAYNVQCIGGFAINCAGTSPQFGIGIEPNAGSGGGSDACRDILIEGYTFTNNAGLHSYAGAVVPIRRVTWKGNRFNDAGNGPSDGQGSCLRGNAIDVSVQGNTFENVVTTSRSAINVQGGNFSGDASNWFVDGNSFNNCDFATSDIYFFNGTGHIASNNKFFNCPDAHVAGGVAFGDINNTTVAARSDPSPVPPEHIYFGQQCFP